MVLGAVILVLLAATVVVAPCILSSRISGEERDE